MDGDISFLGLSQEVWEVLFSVGKSLLPGLVLAVFAVYYQMRKKAEIKLEIEFTKLRITSYEQLLSVFGRVNYLESLDLDEEETVNEIIENFTFPIVSTDYPAMISSESSFDSFYRDLTDVVYETNVFLDNSTQFQTKKSMGFYTLLKLYLDAYSDAECIFCTTEEELQIAKEKVNFAYRIGGVLLASFFNEAYLKIENTIVRQLNDIHIVSQERISVKERIYNWSLPLLRLLDRQLDADGWRQTVSMFLLRLFMGKEYQFRMICLLDFIEILVYLHFSDKYQPNDFFNMEEEQKMELTSSFRMLFYSQIHR